MAIAPSQSALSLPDHTQLPETDGTFVKNFQEHPQSLLLTDSIRPVLDALHPTGQYAIGQDCGIYWQLTEPPERAGLINSEQRKIKLTVQSISTRYERQFN